MTSGRDDPVDALASTANYLRNHGWTTGQPWGMEVRLPDGFDYALTGERVKRDAGFWNAQGVRLARWAAACPTMAMPRSCCPRVIAAFALVIYDNFHGDRALQPRPMPMSSPWATCRIGSRATAPSARSWPREDRTLTRAEREELQQRTGARGIPPLRGRRDHRGHRTIDSVRRFQGLAGLGARRVCLAEGAGTAPRLVGWVKPTIPIRRVGNPAHRAARWVSPHPTKRFVNPAVA